RIRQRQRQQQLEQQRLDELLGVSSDSSSDAGSEDEPLLSSPLPSSTDQVEKQPPLLPPTTNTTDTTNTNDTRQSAIDNTWMEGVETGRSIANRIQDAENLVYAAHAQPGQVIAEAECAAHMFLVSNGREEFRPVAN